MNRTLAFLLCAVTAISLTTVASRSAISAGQGTALVRLQTSTPGTPQTGHLNIAGTATAGNFRGGYTFINTSTTDTAIYGLNSTTITPSTAFLGRSTNTAVQNYGGWFESYGANGTGCVGIATSLTGNPNGGYFRSDAPGGNGVVGFASSTTGDAWGGWFSSASTAGIGIYGVATAASGTTYGGSFLNNSTAGTGVYGKSTATVGSTNGIYGEAASLQGIGVHGVATATSGSSSYGVYGEAASGTGVYGRGGTIGGWFLSDQDFGYGVIGRAIGNFSYAGVFQAEADSGTGVLGYASSINGYGIGVYGKADSPSAWAGYFSGGKGTKTERLSVATSNSAYPIQMADAFGDKISLYGAGVTSVGFGVQGNALQIHTDYAGSDVVFGFGSSTALTETMRVKGNGSVGIGTSTPASLLDVNGRTTTDDFTMNTGGAANTVLLGAAGGVGSWGTVGNTRLTNDSASLSKVTGGSFSISGTDMLGADQSMIQLFTASTEKLRLNPGAPAAGPAVNLFGPNGDYNIRATFLSNFPDNGWFSVNDSAGVAQATVMVNASGDGIVTADTKNFKVPDPDDSRYDILYACVEGPEAAMYTRGTGHLVDGQAVVDLPDHFLKLANMSTLTIQVTPLDECEGLFCRKGNRQFLVKELRKGSSNIDFDWEVKAVRKGHEDYQVVRPWDDALPDGDKKQMWDARLRSIAMRKGQKRP